ncbi:MAG TPA: peptidoglycan DD-metalloendopeptidase family protein [Thermoleophilia bacterium]
MAPPRSKGGRHRGWARPLIAAAVLVCVFSLAFAVGSWKAEPAQAATKAELGQRLEDNRVGLAKVRANIKKADAAKQSALKDISSLDQYIQVLEQDLQDATDARDAAIDKLAAVRAHLAEVNKTLKTKTDQLAKTEHDLETQQGWLSNRVVSIYKSGGQVAYLAAFLEPDGLSRFVGRVDLLSAVLAQDNRALAQIGALKQTVEGQKQALEQEQAEVTDLEQVQKSTTTQLKALATQRQNAVNNLESARGAKQKIVRKAEADKAAWSKQEDQLQSDSDQITALLKKIAGSGTAPHGNGVLAWPVNGNVTSGFGYRMHPIFHVMKMHTGVDISAGMGTPIKAAAAGTVIFAGWRGGYGQAVIISHGNGLATLYAHQSKLLVSVGDKVKRGEVIGKVGSTGYSTGPHLHFEVRVGGNPVDPMGYL